MTEGMVWVVDDDRSIRFVLRKALERAGIPSRAFERAEDVLEALREERPDVLVSDIRMPGMSGLEVQEHLLQRKADIPIIFVTGHGDVTMAVQAFKAGAVDFIEKPYDQNALKALIERMLEVARTRHIESERRKLNQALLDKLTPREQEVLERIANGRLNKQIADDLKISIKTVEAHRASIMDKTNSGTVADLMRVFMESRQGQNFHKDETHD